MVRNLSVAGSPGRAPAPDLRAAVEAALADMSWLKPSDEGLKALALNYAERIEAAALLSQEIDAAWAEVRGDKSIADRLRKLEAAADATKILGWLGQQLQGVLAQLGGAPAARRALQATQPVGGRLAALRNAATGGSGVDNPPGVDPTPR